MMADEDASADCLEQFSRVVGDSDASGLEAQLSVAARENQDDLSLRAEDLMSTIGGGTVDEGHVWMTVGTFAGGRKYVVSDAMAAAPDGAR